MGTPAAWAIWFARGLVVLVIACPCALVIATPVALASALAAAARRGILLKGGQFLEEVGRLRVMAFDKTGTLTRGRARRGRGRPDRRPARFADVLRIAAALGDQGGARPGPGDLPARPDLPARRPRGRRLRGGPRPGSLGPGGRRSSITSAATATSTRPASARPTSTPGSAAPRGPIGTSVALTTADGPIGWIRLADRPRPEAAAVVAELN